jgi:hypothetical protein
MIFFFCNFFFVFFYVFIVKMLYEYILQFLDKCYKQKKIKELEDKVIELELIINNVKKSVNKI